MTILEEWVVGMYSITTVIIAIVVFIYQNKKYRNERYKQYASDLYREDNPTAQITSAILLRSYLKPKLFGFSKSYAKDTLNLIAALLRHTPSGNLQKTLADSLSYVVEADGQDFQYANMRLSSIKPASQIKYTITKDAKYLGERISLRSADFYKANISDSGLYHIDAENAVFFSALLNNTTFHNCILRNANFKDADVHNLKFRMCDLEGAIFSGARRIETARVYKGLNDKDYEPLIKYLDASGKFVGLHTKPEFVVSDCPKKIFISKLGHMNTKQESYYESIKQYLSVNYKYEVEVINPEEYRDSGQLEMIINRMSQCSGVIILAFSYLRVDNGNMVGASSTVAGECYISPWLHIESALANTLYRLPSLVIAERGVCCNGIFDELVVKNEELMCRIDGYDGLFTEADSEQVEKWSRMVDKYQH